MKSIWLFRLEHAHHDDDEVNNDVPPSNDLEPENRLIETTNIEDPSLFAHQDNTQTTKDDDNTLLSQELISTPSTVEEEIVPPEILNIPDDNNATIEINTDTPPAINENDVLNTGFDLGYLKD
jgi:hypothetical protein